MWVNVNAHQDVDRVNTEITTRKKRLDGLAIVANTTLVICINNIEIHLLQFMTSLKENMDIFNQNVSKN